MGKPLFQVFRNVIPVWIAVLRMLKNAPKNLPSLRLSSETDGGANLLMQVIQCGSRSCLQTDSFRMEKPPLRLHCTGRSLTQSFRLPNPSPTHDSESSHTTEYSTAPSVIETVGSPGPNLVSDASPNFNPERLKKLMSDFSNCYASALSEQESSFRRQDESGSDDDVGVTTSEPISEIPDLQRRSRDWTKKHTSSNSSMASRCLPSSDTCILSACSARIFQQSDALVKNSQDPYLDFIASMTEMIAANSLTDKGDLEDLLRCYLYLNPSKHHNIITLAFLEVIAAFTQQFGS